MSGLRPHPDEHDFLVRIRQRRREPDPDTMVFLETLQEGVCQRRLRDAGLTPEQIRSMRPELSDREAEDVAGYLAQVRSSIRPPTPYEHSGFHANVQLMAAQLDEAVARLGRWPNLDRPPMFALLEYGHVNARTVVAPTGDHIVLVDTELLEFLFLFSKAVALAMPAGPPGPGGLLGFLTKKSDVAAHLRRDREPLVRFAELLLAYAMTGRASEAEAYQVPPATVPLYTMIMSSAQTFVLAHEYAHVLERHFDAQPPDDVSGVAGGQVRQSLWSLTLEAIADRVGLELLSDVMDKTGHDFTITYWGVELFLYANEIALKAIGLLRSGDELGLHQHESYLHAGVNARRTMLPVILRGEVDRRLGEQRAGQAWAQLEGGLHVVQDVIDLLWHDAKPLLLAAHHNGARPSAAWES